MGWFSSLHGIIMKGDPIGSKAVETVFGSNDPLNLTNQRAKEQQKQIDEVQAQSDANANTQYGIVSPKIKTIGSVQ